MVVAKDKGDHAGFEELLRRGRESGIPLEEISEKQAKQIKPRAKTCECALFSPAPSTVNPALVLEAMKKDAVNGDVQIHYDVRYLRSSNGCVRITQGDYYVSYVIDAAGLYADRIARDYAFDERYRIVPFKGLYLYLFK